MTDLDPLFQAGQKIATEIRMMLGDRLKIYRIDERLQRQVFFAALHYLIIEVFALAPTNNTPTDKERIDLFDEFQEAVRNDFIATLRSKSAHKKH